MHSSNKQIPNRIEDISLTLPHGNYRGHSLPEQEQITNVEFRNVHIVLSRIFRVESIFQQV